MPVGRKPREDNKADNEPTMLRAVRIGKDVYVPGEEEEMKSALEALAEEDDTVDVDGELHRLTLNGFLANFVELSEDEVEALDTDLRANKTYERHAAQLEEAHHEASTAEGGARERTARRSAKKPAKRARKGATQKRDETSED